MQKAVTHPSSLSWGRIARRVWLRLKLGRMPLIAAGCAFYATLALFPALSVLLSLYGLLFNPRDVASHIDLLRDVLPPDTSALVTHRVKMLTEQRHSNLQLSVWLGAGIALWSASIGTKSLLSSIDHIHGGGDRSFIQFQLTGLAMTLGATLAAVGALAVLVALPGSLHVVHLDANRYGLVNELSLLVLVLFVAASIAALFRFGPSPRPGVQPKIWPGVWAATALWVTVSKAFSLYVAQLANFDLTYGPLAAIAGVMLWFWLSSLVVLVGAELNAACAEGAPD